MWKKEDCFVVFHKENFGGKLENLPGGVGPILAFSAVGEASWDGKGLAIGSLISGCVAFQYA